MVDILIQPPELRRISEQLRTSAQKIAAAMQAIDDAIGSLKGDKFLGNRSNKVQANYAPKREALLTANNIILHFAEDLKNTADVFEKADSTRSSSGHSVGKQKTRIYLVNGINYNNDPDSNLSPDESLHVLERNIEAIYGKDVDVIVVDAHPYESNPKFFPKAPDLIGVGQVEHEYITGGSDQSAKVNQWIQDNLRENAINGGEVDVVLVGHSGGGAVIANISDEIDGLEGVNLKGMVTMGSPISNFDHASQYADSIVDIMATDDWVGKIGGVGTLRSDEMRTFQDVLLATGSTKGILGTVGAVASAGWVDLAFRDSYIKPVTTGSGGHNSYWGSNQVAEIIGNLAVSGSSSW